MAVINFTVEFDALTNVQPVAGEDSATQALVGTVTFTPMTSDLRPIMARNYSPRPAGFRVRPTTGYIDSDGQLRDRRSGQIGVRLWAKDAVLELTRLFYKVDFKLTTPLGEPVAVTGGYFQAPDQDLTVNLTDVLAATGYSAESSPPTFVALGDFASTFGAQLVTAVSAAAARELVELGDDAATKAWSAAHSMFLGG